MLHLVRPIHGFLCELPYESLTPLQLGLHPLNLDLLLISISAVSRPRDVLHPLHQLHRSRNSDGNALLRLYTRSGAVKRSGAGIRGVFSTGKDALDDFPPSLIFVDAPSDLFHAGFGLDKILLIGMIIRSTVDDSGKKERVLEKPLDGLYEKGREVPGVGERRSEASSMFEVRIERRRFLEIVQVLEGGWMSRDVLFVRRFQ